MILLDSDGRSICGRWPQFCNPTKFNFSISLIFLISFFPRIRSFSPHNVLIGIFWIYLCVPANPPLFANDASEFENGSNNFKNSRNRALNLIKELNWENGYHRKDIGFKIID